MPEERRRVFATHTGTFSKVVDVPLRYVYDWCTDFRSDDGKFSGSRVSIRVVRVSSLRLVRIRVVNTGGDAPRMAIELVRLYPPNAWHKDTVDEIDLDSIDYTLTALSPKKTRISLVIVERWLIPKYPSKAEWVRASSSYWDELAKAIEARYRSGRPARG